MKSNLWPLLFVVALFVFPLGKSLGDYATQKIHDNRNAPLRGFEAKNAAERERIREAQRELEVVLAVGAFDSSGLATP